MRLKNLAPTILAALATVFVLAACGQSAGDQQSSQGNQEGQEQAQKRDTPEQETPDKQVAPKQPRWNPASRWPPSSPRRTT